MGRKRMTWQRGNSRRAAAPPAIPNEESGYKHPAHQTPDPEADQYENGDTSSWAEDVHPPPYQNSPHPATPTEAGGYNHPAGNPANLKQAMQRKAHACIRIAQAQLGPRATVAAIENRALSMLDWPNRKVKASLKRVASRRRACGEMGMYGMEDDMGMYGMDDEDMGMYGMDDEDMGMFDEDMDMDMDMYGMDDDEDMGMFDEDMDMYGMDDEDEGMFDDDDMLYGMDDEDEGMDDFDEFDELEEDVYGMLGDYEQMDPVMGPQRFASAEDRMLAEMLREERAKQAKANPMGRFAGLDPEEKRMLAEMLRKAADEEEDDDKDDDKKAEDTGDDDADDKADDGDDDDDKADKKAFGDIDPMGLMDDDIAMDRLAAAGEDEELRSLFEDDLFAAADKFAADEDDEDEDDEDEGDDDADDSDEDDDEDEGAKKKARTRRAAQRPRARKPARRGSPRRLGNVHTAGAENEISELSSIWETRPDVSETFDIEPTNLDVDYP
jgi:hypothetical protein